jgi:hypothetical protein
MPRSALRIDDIDQVHLSPPERISVIWVDLSERPDLAALAVQSAPAANDAVCSWFFGHSGTRQMLIGLEVSLKQPTTAVFTLVFPLERFAGHLLTIAKCGKLWVVPGPPLPHLVGTREMEAQTFLTQIAKYSGRGVWIELESHLVGTLRAQLDEWKPASSH